MAKTVSKPDLVQAIADGAGIAKTKADAALDALVGAVVSNVAKGNDVRVPGLGTWKRAARKARTGRNPQTGAAVKIPATKVPKFSAAVGFKDEVSGGKKAPAKKAAAKKAPARKKR